MMSASLGLAGIAAYLNLRELSLTRAVLVSQSCAVAAGLTHPVGGLLWWAALLLLTLYFDLRRLRFRQLMTALIPYVVGGIGWGIYIARSPSDFWAQFIGNNDGDPK